MTREPLPDFVLQRLLENAIKIEDVPEQYNSGPVVMAKKLFIFPDRPDFYLPIHKKDKDRRHDDWEIETIYVRVLFKFYENLVSKQENTDPQ